VVLGRVAAEEDELELAARRFELTGVGDGKTEDPCVKIAHSRQVGDEHPHVAESKFRNRHL
jgi:hypothetical protein